MSSSTKSTTSVGPDAHSCRASRLLRPAAAPCASAQPCDGATLYTYPGGAPRATGVRVTVNGHEAFVYQTAAAAFVSFTCTGRATIRAEFPHPLTSARVRPYRRGIRPALDGHALSFDLEHPTTLAVETDGSPPLYVFANAPEHDVPSPDDPRVHYFEGGRIHEAGELRLHDGETLYLAPGAVVRGYIRASHARGIRICGRGILDGSHLHQPGQHRRMIILSQCRHALLEGITVIEPPSWMVVAGACHDVAIRDLKLLGSVVCSDGIDIVGSSHVTVDGCFIATNDDCVAIKSVTYNDGAHEQRDDLRGNVDHIRVQRCAFLNGPAGNAMEIGYELQADLVQDIVFADCDVVHVHGFGAAFSIHNSDRALVRNVRYENIRVEHCYDKVIELRIVTSRYGRDTERGRIQNVTFKNIEITYNHDNYGHTVSLIGGFDANHLVENVTFDNVCINGQKVTCADQLDLYVKHARRIVFT